MSKCLSRHTLSRLLLAVFLLLGTLPLTVSGQITSQDAEALSNWMDDFANLPAAIGQDELPRYVPGWFNEVEIRSETDEFKLNQQRYALRAEPKLPHVRRAERRIQNAQRAGLAEISEEVLADGRSDALMLLFELTTDAREAELVDTLYHVQSRLVDVTRLRVVEPGYDIEKVLDAEDELSKIKFRLNELLNLQQTTKLPIGTKALVQLEDIRFRLISLKDIGPSVFGRQATTLEQIDAEMALERAENLSFLKFVQVQYRSSPDQDDLTRDLVSVGGSISFPRRERHNRQLDKLKVERLEEVYDFELKKRERERSFNIAVLNLQRMFTAYDELQMQTKSRYIRRTRLGETYLKSAISRPESLLRLSRRNIGDRLSLLQLEEDIKEGYADLLGDFVALDAAGIQRWVLR